MNRLSSLVEALPRTEGDDLTGADTKLKLRLLEAVAANALQGKEFAAITVEYSNASQTELYDSWGQIVRLSEFAQGEGFQTDEAHHEKDEYGYHQLTVFWGKGKEIHEQQSRLGEVDLDLLDAAA